MVINKNKAFWLPAGSESFENPSGGDFGKIFKASEGFSKDPEPAGSQNALFLLITFDVPRFSPYIPGRGPFIGVSREQAW